MGTQGTLAAQEGPYLTGDPEHQVTWCYYSRFVNRRKSLQSCLAKSHFLISPLPLAMFPSPVYKAKPGGSGCLYLIEGGLSLQKSQWEPWVLLSLLFSRVTAFWSGLAAPRDAMAAQHQPASPQCQVVIGQDHRDDETLLLSFNSAFGS